MNGHEKLMVLLKKNGKIRWSTTPRGETAAESVDRHYVAAMQGELARSENDVNELLELLKKEEGEKDRALCELEATQDALVEAEEKLEALSEADTVTLELSPREKLELRHLGHRHDLLAERVDSKLAPAIRDAARANHRSRWLLGLVWAIFAFLALTAATLYVKVTL